MAWILIHSIVSANFIVSRPLTQLHLGDNLAMLMMTIFEVVYSFGILFIACEICQRNNLAFNECNEMTEQCKWYSFPMKIQRMLPLILNFMQQPVEIKCFGGLACERETFKHVRRIRSKHY